MSQSSRKKFVPAVESLETRFVPATIAVTTFADVVNPTDRLLSLREAITRANATPALDTIVLRAGVYRVGYGRPGDNANASGDLDITNPMVLRGQGAAATVIDGGRRDRLFEILGTYGVGFARMTLRNGAVPSNLDESLDGGAIRASTASLSLNGCVVTANSGTNGGGIYVDTGNVTLVATTLTGNVAKGYGGGVHLGKGTLTMRDSVVRRNLAGSNGGGIFAGTAILSNSTVAGNFASQGGGIFAGTAALNNSTANGNFATVGGGLYAENAILTNSTFSGNTAGKVGGGIFAFAGTVTNCTITENSASEGGGVVQTKGGRFTLRNTIVAQNLVPYGGLDPDLSGEFVSLGHNLIGAVPASKVPKASGAFGGNGDQVGTPDNPLDAGLAPLAYYGGRTMTHALLKGSRAIDRGDNTGTPATDQRGVARRRDGDGNRVAIIDIGAYER